MKEFINDPDMLAAKVKIDAFIETIPAKIKNNQLPCEHPECMKINSRLDMNEFHIIMLPKELDFEIKIVCKKHLMIYMDKFNLKVYDYNGLHVNEN